MSNHGYQHLLIEAPEPAIVLLYLNRPDAANALNTAMAREITQFFAALPKNCRAVVLAGKGRHFCAGADLKERQRMNEQQWHAQHEALEKAINSISSCPSPVITAVQGAAMAGGLELALAADFIYASEDARFAMTEATLGIMPGLGGTQRLPRRIGIARAKELLFTGKKLTAQEAQAWGLVNRLCRTEALLTEALDTARTIAANAPLSVKAIKNAINQGVDIPLPEALQNELTHYETLLSTRDRHEGVNSFSEKRKPVFTGE